MTREEPKPADEPKVVEEVRALCAKFVSPLQAFRAGQAPRVGTVTRTYRNRLLVRFSTGRWTISGSITSVRLGHVDDRGRHESRWRGTIETDIKPYLEALVAVELLTQAQKKAFEAWHLKRYEAGWRAQRVAQLEAEARPLGLKVVPRGKAAQR